MALQISDPRTAQTAEGLTGHWRSDMDDLILRSKAHLFWAKVEPFAGLDACWLWTGKLHHRGGYGGWRIKVGGRSVYFTAHRVAYQLLVGEIPEGLQLDHLCRNRACVNPDHLEPVTQAVNLRRGADVMKMGRRKFVDGVRVCGNGHPMVGDNARPRKTHPHGVCLQCARDGMARYKSRLAS